MRVDEFKDEIRDIGWLYDEDIFVETVDGKHFVMHGNVPIAMVTSERRYRMDTSCLLVNGTSDSFISKIFDAIYEFAKTPIEDRKELPRYIVPLPGLVTTDGRQQYLTHKLGKFFACGRDVKLRQTWKEKDLEHIPEEYRKYAVELSKVE